MKRVGSRLAILGVSVQTYYPSLNKISESFMQQEHRECIELCYECAAACDICASSCLREDNVENDEAPHPVRYANAYICCPEGNSGGIGKRVLTKLCRLCAISQSLRRRVRPLPELRAGMQPMRRRLALKWPRNFSSAISSTGYRA